MYSERTVSNIIIDISIAVNKNKNISSASMLFSF